MIRPRDRAGPLLSLSPGRGTGIAVLEDQLKETALSKLVEFVAPYADMDRARLREMVDHIPVKLYPKGTALIHQGEEVTRCFFILEGCARKYSVDESGNEVTSDFITENQAVVVFGPDIAESPYSFTCLEDSLMIVGDLAEEQSEYDRYPEFADITRRMIEDNMGTLQSEFTDFIRLSPEDRVKRMMDRRPELFDRVPQHQLASFLGITPESLSRIKRRLVHGDLKLVD